MVRRRHAALRTPWSAPRPRSASAAERPSPRFRLLSTGCLGGPQHQRHTSEAPAIVAGFALVFARSLGEYGSVVFVSGNMPLRTEIPPVLVVALSHWHSGLRALGLDPRSAPAGDHRGAQIPRAPKVVVFEQQHSAPARRRPPYDARPRCTPPPCTDPYAIGGFFEPGAWHCQVRQPAPGEAGPGIASRSLAPVWQKEDAK
jgi:hypothetical protein